jgi:hypothetical protein
LYSTIMAVPRQYYGGRFIAETATFVGFSIMRRQ